MKGQKRIQPIRSRRDHEVALTRLDALMDLEARSSEENYEFDVLLALIRTYESERYPMDRAEPIEVIKLSMERKRMKPVDLVPIFRSRAKVSEALRGERDPTLKMIRGRKEHLDIPPEMLTTHG